MVRLSHPECAMTSAEKELGTCSPPLTPVPPSCQIFLRRFSPTLPPPPPRLGCPRVAPHAPIHPGSRRRSPPARLSRRYRSFPRDPRHVSKDTSAPAARTPSTCFGEGGCLGVHTRHQCAKDKSTRTIPSSIRVGTSLQGSGKKE